MKTDFTMVITGGDLFLLVVAAWLACTVSIWWIAVVFLDIFSWFALIRWSKAEGWRFWR